jgi:hypothetical protein
MTKNDIDTLEELNNRLNNEGWKSETNNKIIDMLPEIIKELKTRITLKEIFEEKWARNCGFKKTFWNDCT